MGIPCFRHTGWCLNCERGFTSSYYIKPKLNLCSGYDVQTKHQFSSQLYFFLRGVFQLPTSEDQIRKGMTMVRPACETVRLYVGSELARRRSRGEVREAREEKPEE